MNVFFRKLNKLRSDKGEIDENSKEAKQACADLLPKDHLFATLFCTRSKDNQSFKTFC